MAAFFGRKSSRENQDPGQEPSGIRRDTKRRIQHARPNSSLYTPSKDQLSPLPSPADLQEQPSSAAQSFDADPALAEALAAENAPAAHQGVAGQEAVYPGTPHQGDSHRGAAHFASSAPAHAEASASAQASFGEQNVPVSSDSSAGVATGAAAVAAGSAAAESFSQPGADALTGDSARVPGNTAASAPISASTGSHASSGASHAAHMATEPAAVAVPVLPSLSRYSAGAKYAKMRRRRRAKSIAQKTLISILVILLLGVVTAFGYILDINSRLSNHIDSDLRHSLVETSYKKPFYMLLLGIDKSKERTHSASYGPSEHAYRSDSILLTRIDPPKKQVTFISIHRDTLIHLGKYGPQKINAAYAFGGPALAVRTISKFAGVPISHYAEIDFDNFVKIVDTLGGIDINVPVAVNDPHYTGGHIKAGQQHINGAQALILARARHAYDKYGDGDLYRAANQRAILATILKKVLASDPATMAKTISEMANSVNTDMSLPDILSLGLSMRGLDPKTGFYSGMEPTTSKYMNNLWFEICDEDAWHAMMKRVDQGLPPYDSRAEDKTRGVAGLVTGTNLSLPDPNVDKYARKQEGQKQQGNQSQNSQGAAQGQGSQGAPQDNSQNSDSQDSNNQDNSQNQGSQNQDNEQGNAQDNQNDNQGQGNN